MSQIHYQYLSLENIIKSSRYIIIAEKLIPFVTREEIPIGPLIKISGKKSYPPYTRTFHCFKVKKLLQTDSKINAGDEIIVSEPHFEASYKMHKEYYCEGKSRSPLFKSYKPGFNLEDVTSCILFLVHQGDIFEYSANWSYESIEKLKQIKKILRKSR